MTIYGLYIYEYDNDRYRLIDLYRTFEDANKAKQKYTEWINPDDYYTEYKVEPVKVL